jgi:hypothetical protein
MANKSGDAYGLTLLCPIRDGVPKDYVEGLEGQTHAACLRQLLQGIRVSEESPMALVPNTYLSRFYLLDDVPYQGKPAVREHLKSSYLVFASNFHGELEPYLEGMWAAIEGAVRSLLRHCYGFEAVHDAASFVAYIQKCQVATTFFFNGSSDEPVAAQLKSLYLKQEFSRFALENQGRSPVELQAAFEDFVKRVQPENVENPTWRPGSYKLEKVVFDRGKGDGAE